jgi:hypothetical protein
MLLPTGTTRSRTTDIARRLSLDGLSGKERRGSDPAPCLRDAFLRPRTHALVVTDCYLTLWNMES